MSALFYESKYRRRFINFQVTDAESSVFADKQLFKKSVYLSVNHK